MKPDQLSDKEIIDKFEGGMGTSEKGRADGLKNLQTLQRVKNRAQVKEHRRLQTKLGAQHQRVQRLAASIQYNQGLDKDLAVEIDKSAIDAPVLEENSWMAHGRVMDTHRLALPGLTVGIFNDQGQWFSQAGYACTDPRGYFSIVYTPEENAEEETKNVLLFFLHVIGPDGTLLYKDPAPLSPEGSRIVYREIFIDRDQTVCNAPQNGRDDSDVPTCGPWVLHGTVTDTQGNRLAGMRVAVVYRKSQKEIKLGSAQTAENGSYEVTYQATDAKQGPDPGAGLYVVVSDSSGEIVYTPDDKIVYIPGQKIAFDIRIASPG